MSEVENKLVDTFDVPVVTPEIGMRLQESVPVIASGSSTFEDTIATFETLEEGFVLYRITTPVLPHRFVLANTAYADTPVFLSVVSGRYRVLRPSATLKLLHEALQVHTADYNKSSIRYFVQKQMSVTINHPEYKFPVLTYVNSFDRTTRESVILPGLRAVKYTHTNNGKNKTDAATLIDLALNRAKTEEWFDKLRTAEVTKAIFMRYVRGSLSMTPRSVLLKVFKYQGEISDMNEKDFEVLAYNEYRDRYGSSALGFVEFAHDLHRIYNAQNKVHRAVMAIQAGASIVGLLVH